MQHFGMDKAGAAAQLLQTAYPYTNVTALSYKLGDFGPASKQKTAEFVNALETSDVIVDCSAERGVQQFLSDEAWLNKKDYFFLEAYPGALSGFVGSVAPGIGPCYYCFLNGRATGEIPAPLVPRNAMIQPAGCGEQTFVGAPFDADTLAAAGVRLIFSKLAKNGSYPSSASPFYRATFADDLIHSRVVIEPIEIPRKNDCPVCGKA